MKTQKIDPKTFCGAAFAERHGLTPAQADAMYIKGGMLHYPDSLPDHAADPGGLDAPKSRTAEPASEIARVKSSSASLADVCKAVAWLLAQGGK